MNFCLIMQHTEAAVPNANTESTFFRRGNGSPSATNVVVVLLVVIRCSIP